MEVRSDAFHAPIFFRITNSAHLDEYKWNKWNVACYVCIVKIDTFTIRTIKYFISTKYDITVLSN